MLRLNRVKIIHVRALIYGGKLQKYYPRNLLPLPSYIIVNVVHKMIFFFCEEILDLRHTASYRGNFAIFRVDLILCEFSVYREWTECILWRRMRLCRNAFLPSPLNSVKGNRNIETKE